MEIRKRSEDNVKIKVHFPGISSDVGLKSFPPPQPRLPDGSLRVTRSTRDQVHTTVVRANLLNIPECDFSPSRYHLSLSIEV